MTKAKRAEGERSKGPASVATEPVKVDIDLTATEAAWRKHEPRARALRPFEVAPARVDVTQAAAIAMVGARNVLDQRERLVAEFKAPPLDVFERVAEVALAAQHADLVHRAAQDEDAPFADILPRMIELRGCLLDDLAAQVRRRRAPAKLLADVRAGDNSVRDKANDLNDLASFYRANWDKVSKKTTVEAEEIGEAGDLAAKALARMGAVAVARTPKPGELSTADLRRRGFTLLAQDYELVRRYAAFLFWDLPGAWEQYAPSLYTARAAGGSAKTATDPAPAPAPAPQPA